MAALNLTPNLAAAETFLDALDSAGIFSFQTFPEGPSGAKNPSPTILHGRLTDVAPRLALLNNGGHGIFVMVNEGDLKGRSAANVMRIRAHFVDLDGAPIQPVRDAALSPHIIVQSSPGKWHAYWRNDDCPLDQFKVRQHALAERFDGDKAVCDLPRVMRLPGFWHLKSGTPFQTALIKPNK